MSSIGTSIRHLESFLKSFSLEVFASILPPKWIEAALEQSGRQGERDRKLTATFTVWLTIAMGLYRTLSIQNVVRRLGLLPGLGSLWEDGKAPSSASDSEARRRLGFAPLRLLWERLREWILQSYPEALSWRGKLLLALDGTTFKVANSQENLLRFGLPKTSRGKAAFPQMRALFLGSAKMRFLIAGIFAPYRRAEIHMAHRMIPLIPPNSLVLLDRNFNAWAFLLGIGNSGSDFLVRAKDNIRGIPLCTLGAGDRLVRMYINPRARHRNPWIPRHVVLREISARIQGVPYRFFTSLLDPQAFPAVDLVLRYADRWQVETAFDELKTHLCPYTTVNRPVLLRCKSSRLVLQEAYGLVLAYNLIRVLIAQAGLAVDVPVLHISFVDSLESIRATALVMATSPTQRLQFIFADLLSSMATYRLPRRRRSNPRAVCVKMSSYPLRRNVA